MSKKKRRAGKVHRPLPVLHARPEQATWPVDKTGRVTPQRRAEFWRPLARKRIACDLCYRRCEIEPGAAGWCGYRANERGTMALRSHGVLSCAVRQMRGYGPDPFLTFKAGGLSLFLGGTNCTAGCTFCMSKEITWRPDAVSWTGAGPWAAGNDGGWYNRKAVLHPAGAVALAKRWGCTQVEFGINEPTLSIEYTSDVARLAKGAGLDVLIETNGFSGAGPVRRLARHVDAVDVGVKGSGDPAFYERWMRSPGAMPAVLEAAKAWRESGVHLIVGDVIAPPQMQTNAEAEEAQRRLHGWIADELGPLTPVLITPMFTPGPARPWTEKRWNGFLLPARSGDEDLPRYRDRIERAHRIAQAAGLDYAHQKTSDEVLRCHNCGGTLLRFREPQLECGRHDGSCLMPRDFCPWWTHEQHATDGRCDHCGAQVPIVTLSASELATSRATVLEASRGAGPDPRPVDGPNGEGAARLRTVKLEWALAEGRAGVPV